MVRANPSDYVSKYGYALKTFAELLEFLKEIRPPTGIVQAAEYRPPSVHELEGDLHALKLINLETEGLSQ